MLWNWLFVSSPSGLSWDCLVSIPTWWLRTSQQMKILRALGQVKEVWKNLGTLTALTASSLTAVLCCVVQCLPA
ncbi:hypothetical protein Q7C36_006590 [Tachysurus vachellii]|uniref:Uncharacterized protein n=1 Tax=Tachysurus vachellii TaxID=175792 RepID=A0AA88T5J0_TACVA|nr:hypothetical protein Q7C36_006590 [Tachysurus vachellii]